MAERRFSEEEVAAIFARATETQHAAPGELTPGLGMTLAEVQAIGKEAGIAPEAVEQAARSLAQGPPPREPRLLGLPIGVRHTIELGRRMTDPEWERLVVELRETFEARGKLHSEGSFRQWSNGNLQVLLEPSGDGHRIRFRTLKSGARMMILTGLGLLGSAVVVGFVSRLTLGAVDLWGSTGDIGMLALVGVGLLVAAAVQLPGWARLRKRQMEELAARLIEPS